MYDNALYRFFNQPWFVWTVVVTVFTINVLSPLIVWFLLGGRSPGRAKKKSGGG